jgi:hypothetical protein
MDKPKRKRRTKAELEKANAEKVYTTTTSEGLGDTIEKITEATGIKKLVKWMVGEDCGCDERKQKLNELFPYKKVNCMLEEEYLFFKEWYDKNTDRIKPSEAMVLLKMYNRIFNRKEESTTCASCWREYIQKLTNVYNTYKDDNSES